ncbi:ABC transporter substrate-binding protein [Brachybacterium kimchii]|uniref:ABC transporter substrate-binding protein n=1 Tax=Brachybacterium kimchii TaxID=2942909 RepID=A0ABY4N2Z9_9MICO|nr:ABC transporter substrate-binding protein [Brachybacterium kimchii]UQN28918.1 ABC transporter substrate-binding protein [Brachybacterium kimchii]
MTPLTRRRFAALATTAASGAALAACSSGGSGGGGGKASDSFTYWSMWKEGEPQQKVLAEEIQNFTKDTGVKVDVQWSGREVLTQVVPRLNAGNPPDLVDNGAPDIAGKLGLDNVMGLEDVFGMDIDGEDGRTVGDVVPEALLDTMSNDDGDPFLVPYEVIGSTLWFNAKVTPELADKAPASWDDFMKILDDLKADGRTPIALDGDIADYCGYWVEWGVLRAGGAGALKKAALDTTGKGFEDPAWKVATENVQALIEGGYLPEGFNGTKFPTQQASWADQTSKTDVILMGSWLPSEAAASLEKSGENPASIEYGSFPFPSVGDDAGKGLVEAQPVGFAIPAKARKADAAKKFMAYFMAKDRISRIATEAKNLTPRTDVDPPEELKDYFEEYSNAKTTVLFADGVSVEAPKWATDVWQPALIDFFGGKLDAAGFRAQLAEKTKAAG